MGVDTGHLQAMASINLVFRVDDPRLLDKAADFLMQAMLAHPEIIDPIVSNDLDDDALSVSFEFEASGQVETDRTRIVALLAASLRSAAKLASDDPFDWVAAWTGKPAGSVQYPLAAAV